MQRYLREVPPDAIQESQENREEFPELGKREAPDDVDIPF
jgi:hypothetical protein